MGRRKSVALLRRCESERIPTATGEEEEETKDCVLVSRMEVSSTRMHVREIAVLLRYTRIEKSRIPQNRLECTHTHTQ